MIACARQTARLPPHARHMTRPKHYMDKKRATARPARPGPACCEAFPLRGIPVERGFRRRRAERKFRAPHGEAGRSGRAAPEVEAAGRRKRAENSRTALPAGRAGRGRPAGRFLFLGTSLVADRGRRGKSPPDRFGPAKVVIMEVMIMIVTILVTIIMTIAH